jgi:hypothetical protein
LMRMAEHGIRNEGYQPPDAKELRRIMRLYVSSARRGRQGEYSVPFYIEAKRFLHGKSICRYVRPRSIGAKGTDEIMKVDPIFPKRRRININAHQRSRLIPKVRQLLKVLIEGWPVMRPLERGLRLRELISLGCSMRGIGRDMEVSPTNIRKHVEIAGLPESDRKAIDEGASAKKVLALKAIANRQMRRQQRIDEDKRTGALSDEIATTILEFCRLGKELRKEPLLEGDISIFLDSVRWYISQFEADGHRAVRISKTLELKAQFRRTRPPKDPNRLFLAYQGAWLAEFLRSISPESPIRERALRKAEIRRNELKPKLTPRESCNRRILRLQEVSQSHRRQEKSGTWRLKRQGRQA